MRVEYIPFILGGLAFLAGLGLVADAWLDDRAVIDDERRRRVRAERNRRGEAFVGLGIACMGAALFGRDSWRYGNIAVIAGTIALLAGAWLNRKFLKELVLFRGASRRADVDPEATAPSASNAASGTAADDVSPERYRIR